ncbi:MAG: hypothetical protein ACYDHA_02970, partial [Bellilinea sp.]
MDKVWEQKKLQATLREMLENGDESHQSGARCVRRLIIEKQALVPVPQCFVRVSAQLYRLKR